MEILHPIVKELFDRSQTAVFALCQGPRTDVFPPKPTPDWPLNLGLAARLQHATVRPMLRPHRDRDIQASEDLSHTYEPLAPDRYELATTDHLLAELYRLGSEAQWVLGLWRPRKFRGHWSGLCWHGGAVVCSGLASCLVARIGGRVREARERQRKQGEGLPEDIGALFSAAIGNARSPRPGRTYMAGLIGMAAVLAGTYGDDGDPDASLADFVRLD